MESTGIYWIPLFALLERRGSQAELVDPRQTTHAPGRPTSDVLDCPWIQRLHSRGLRTASFRPEGQGAVPRAFRRQRRMLIRYAGQRVQHVRKALERRNVKLPEVVRDIAGVTGRAIRKAIRAGEREPRKLAALRDERCKRTEAAIARALPGNGRAEHLCAPQPALELYQDYRRRPREGDAKREAHRAAFADESDGKKLTAKPRRCGRRRNAPACGVRAARRRRSGPALTVLEGIDDNTALGIVSAIGTDVSRWPTEKHFTSWLGLWPRQQGSAGKVKSRRVRRGRNRAARAFRLAAQGGHHAKNARGAFCRRTQARGGGLKAVFAPARKIAERGYRLLKYGAAYVRPGTDACEAAYREQLRKGLAYRARSRGFALAALSDAGPAAAAPPQASFL